MGIRATAMAAMAPMMELLGVIPTRVRSSEADHGAQDGQGSGHEESEGVGNGGVDPLRSCGRAVPAGGFPHRICRRALATSRLARRVGRPDAPRTRRSMDSSYPMQCMTTTSVSASSRPASSKRPSA